ncbi:MAG: ATP-binding protein [Candidatus Moraniibacteriota bacterium]|nr:MAG: ATP-binding protein [Candidatus Moranbacteria bacterium]
MTFKRDLLEEVVADQALSFASRNRGIARLVNFDNHKKSKMITVISGVRRSGKSTLLSQFFDLLGGGHYLNFDDERLSEFVLEDFRTLLSIFDGKKESDTFFFDEIQNVSGWERFVRRLHDEGKKVFVTGSNATLLSGELGTHLTGRYKKIELYPFSFSEYICFKEINITDKTSKNCAKIVRGFDEYAEMGGFPGFLLENDREILQRIYEDILYRDLLVRFQIREVEAFRKLASFLFANVGKNIGYSSLKNILGFASATSVKNYVSFLEESFLLFEMRKYDASLKKQYVSEKKIYAVDNGLRNAISFSASEDRGRMLENAVYMELRRRGKDVFFFKEKRECDFVVRKGIRIAEAIQVCENISDLETKDREVSGLVEAMNVLHLSSGTIITRYEEETIEIEGKKIYIVPAWKWFLEI